MSCRVISLHFIPFHFIYQSSRVACGNAHPVYLAVGSAKIFILLVKRVSCARSFTTAFFPTEEEAQGFATIEAIADWVGLNVLVIPAIEKQTGVFANMHHNLAMLPPIVIREAVKDAKITVTDGQERLLAPVEAAQIGLVWRITRRKMSGNWAGWVDVDPFEVPSDPGAAPPPVRVAEASSLGAKKLKMAHILDQGDESEFTLADAGHITVWLHNFVAITHGQPHKEETPTNEQLSALNVRVVVSNWVPLTPTSPFSHFFARENHQSSSFHR